MTWRRAGGSSLHQKATSNVTIEIETRDGYHVARLAGEFTAADGATIEQDLHPLISERHAMLIVDLAGVQAIDSGGLSQLISLNTHARLSESRVVLCGPTPFVAGVLEVTRLNVWFEIATDVPAAEQLLK